MDKSLNKDVLDSTAIESGQSSSTDLPIPDSVAKIGTEESAALTPDQIADVKNDIQMEQQFGDQPLKAAAAGAARGASFGISDQILTSKKFGKMITGKDEALVDPQTLRELEERNQAASMIGEAGAIGAQALATGGTSLAAKAGAGAVGAAAKAGQIGEKLTESALKYIIKNTGSEKLAAQIIQKGIAKTAGSAVEGGFYGAGQLVSEDALGTSEFNAENLLSSVGTGALLGGAVGGALGSMEALVPVVKRGGKVVVEKGRQSMDSEKAAMELIGLSPSQITKLRKTSPDIAKELPEFLTKEADLGYFMPDKKLYDSVELVKDKAGESIGNILNSMEDIARISPDIVPTKKSLYTKIIKNLDDNFINPYKNIPEYSSITQSIKRLRNDYANKVAKAGDERFMPKELNELRQKLDQVIKYNKVPGTRSLTEEATVSNRALLREEIDNIASRAESKALLAEQKDLFSQLKQANKRFRISSEILPHLEGKIDKSKFLSNMDVLRGGALIGVLKDAGAIAAAAIKLNESDLARRFKVLTQIEKSNNNVASKVFNAVSQFLKPVKNAAKPTSINVLLNTTYGRKDLKGKKPESRLEAFENTANNLAKITTDSDYLQERLGINTLRLTKHAPETAVAVQNKVVNIAHFLQSKMPKDARQTGALDLKRSKWKPSSTQLAKFERYVEAAEHPLNILEDLKTGTVSPEQVETLKAVYPDLYKRIQSSVMEQVSTAENIPYSKRLQLGLLLDIPADSSLTPAVIKSLQTTFKTTEPEKEPAPTRLQSLKVNNSLQTPVEKTMTRK